MKDKNEKMQHSTKPGQSGHEKDKNSQHLEKHDKHHDKHEKGHGQHDKHEKGHGQHDKHEKGHGHHDKHEKGHGQHDKHEKGHGQHDKHEKGHGHQDKHHALKGATMNASPVNSSHPVRHRSRSFTRKDTTHSGGHGSVKGHSHKDHDRGSASSGEVMHHAEVKYENTFKMLPDFRFLESKIKDIMVNVFQENITENQYDPQAMGQKCKLASEIIKEKVKTLNMQRFKIICHVLAAQKGEQSMVITSRCLWDQRFDNSATVSVKRGDYYIIGMVFAVYAE